MEIGEEFDYMKKKTLAVIVVIVILIVLFAMSTGFSKRTDVEMQPENLEVNRQKFGLHNSDFAL